MKLEKVKVGLVQFSGSKVKLKLGSFGSQEVGSKSWDLSDPMKLEKVEIEICCQLPKLRLKIT